MNSLVVPTAIQVIEAEQEPLTLYVTEQKDPAGLVRIDATSTLDTIYVGKAPVGTLENDTGWIVKRFIFTATGIAMTKSMAVGIYANRAFLPYTVYT